MKTTWGVALGTIMAWGGVAAAQDAPVEEAPPPPPPSTLAPTITGFIDGTYNYNLMDPNGGLTPFHSYTAPHNTFLLNSAHLAIGGHDDAVTYNIEIDAGTDAALNSFAYGGSLFDIQEAWVHYVHPESKAGLKAGKFVTYNGIEVVENTANPTISRGFLFGLAEPVSHIGAVGTYQINDQLDVAAGMISGWDLLVDNNNLKTIIAKLGYTSDQLGLTVSAYAGPEQAGNNDDWRTTLDATAVIKLDKLDLWIQGNFGRESFGDTDAMWFGAGVQPVFRLNELLSLGARAEVFIDGDGARTGVPLPDGVTLINVSVAPAYLIADNLTLRAELRVDVATEDVYNDRAGDPTGMQLIGLTEVLYTFGM